MNRILLTLTTSAAVVLGGSIVAAHEHGEHSEQAEHSPATHAIHMAVAAPDRPEAAKALDESRKPAEVLDFLGLKPGMTAADLMTSGGYWAEIMGHVVGGEGKVIGYQPQAWGNDEPSKAAWAALEARSPAVTEVRYPFDAFAPEPESLDFAIMNLIYHDLYWVSERFSIPFTDPRAYAAALYAGMKPGGIVGVIDHTGGEGDTREIVDATHRINPDDDVTMSVFAPEIRGKTDRFIMRFVKPGGV